jgi:hypothetical protein
MPTPTTWLLDGNVLVAMSDAQHGFLGGFLATLSGKLRRIQPRTGRDVHNRRCSAAKPPVSHALATKPRMGRDYRITRCWWCVSRCNLVAGAWWALQGKVARSAAKSSNKMAAF